MKRITTVLLTGTAALFMTACGGGSSDSGTIQPPPESTPPSGIIGSGTIDDPYIVGSGEFKFDGTKYYEITSLYENCNVIAYNINNLNPWGQTEMYDDTFEEIPQEDGYTYRMEMAGTYMIKANAYKTDEATLGIYSTCIDQHNDKYEIDSVQINSQNKFSLDRYSKLYKFKVPNDSIVTVRTISNTDYVYYYDSNLNHIFKTYSDEPIELTTGSYYVMVTQFGYGSEETPTFYFSVESK